MNVGTHTTHRRRRLLGTTDTGRVSNARSTLPFVETRSDASLAGMCLPHTPMLNTNLGGQDKCGGVGSRYSEL